LLVGGLVTQLRPPSPPAAQVPAPTPVVLTRLAHSGASAPVFTYIEVDGQTLPVVLTENPTDNSSVGRGPASASPSLDLSGGGWGERGPGAGSPHFGPRQGSPSPGPGGLPPEASQPDGNPMPPPTTGHMPPLPRTPGEQLNCTPATISAPDSESPNALPPGARPCPTHLASSGDPADNESNGTGSPPPQGEPGNESRESPDNVPGVLSEAPESRFTPGNDAGAPISPLQDEPRYELLEPPFFGSAPSPFEAPESQLPTGMNDPLNPLIPLSEQPEPLLTSPYDGQSLPQTAAAVPEPSVIGLMLLGLAALGWTGRRRLTPTRGA
jgi:hypothetical protein